MVSSPDSEKNELNIHNMVSQIPDPFFTRGALSNYVDERGGVQKYQFRVKTDRGEGEEGQKWKSDIHVVVE